MQLKPAGLFKYVWPFTGHQALKDKQHWNIFFKKKEIKIKVVWKSWHMSG